jgi:hypothetical protein
MNTASAVSYQDDHLSTLADLGGDFGRLGAGLQCKLATPVARRVVFPSFKKHIYLILRG